MIDSDSIGTFTGFKAHEFVAHTNKANCVAVGPRSGQVLATGGDDKVRCRPPDTGTVVSNQRLQPQYSMFEGPINVAKKLFHACSIDVRNISVLSATNITI